MPTVPRSTRPARQGPSLSETYRHYRVRAAIVVRRVYDGEVAPIRTLVPLRRHEITAMLEKLSKLETLDQIGIVEVQFLDPLGTEHIEWLRAGIPARYRMMAAVGGGRLPRRTR